VMTRSWWPLFLVYKAFGLAPCTPQGIRSMGAICYNGVLGVGLLAYRLIDAYDVLTRLSNQKMNFLTQFPIRMSRIVSSVACVVTLGASVWSVPTLRGVAAKMSHINRGLFKPGVNIYDNTRRTMWKQLAMVALFGVVDVVLNIANYSTKVLFSPFSWINTFATLASMFSVLKHINAVLVIASSYDAVNRHLQSLLDNVIIENQPGLIGEAKVQRDDLFPFDLSSSTGRAAMVNTVQWTHLALRQVSDDVNSAFGLIAFVTVGQLLFGAIIHTYTLSLDIILMAGFLLRIGSPRWKTWLGMACIDFLVVAPNVGLIGALAWSCQKASAASARTALLARRCLYLKENVELKKLARDLAARSSISFSAMGLFDINMDIVLSSLDAIISYAVVMITRNILE
jgi:7tm Chemosensory receptor